MKFSALAQNDRLQNYIYYNKYLIYIKSDKIYYLYSN